MHRPNIYFNKIQDAKAYISEEWTDEFPDIVFMTGTGLAGVVDELKVLMELSYKAVSYTHLTLPTKA